MKLAADRLSR